MQGDTVDCGSLHFFEEPEEETEERQGSYISYAKVPVTWRLDNGMLPPKKKFFENCFFNDEDNTFIGEIIWEGASF